MAGVLDHNVEGANFHARIKVGGSVTLEDGHLTRALGVADRDLLSIDNISFTTASNPTKVPVGIVVSHEGGQPLRSADRTISLHAGDDTVESVHALVHPNEAQMPFVPSTLNIHTPTESTRANVVRTATARAARWNNAKVDQLNHDVTLHEMDGQKPRHLVDSVITETSSPVAILFHRNESNPNFLNNNYSSANRKMVGDKFVVTDADMTTAVKSLRTNLTPQMHSGLKISATPLHGSTIADADDGCVTVAFNVKRKPLSEACYANEEPTRGIFSVKQGLEAMGETVTAKEIALTSTGSDITSSVFAEKMHDE